MFTQCAKCETVFRLSAEALRAAGGQVRCGRCGEVFNALARLAEDASGFATGESALYLEERADAILHSTLPVEPVDTSVSALDGTIGPPGVEIAHLQILDAPGVGTPGVATPGVGTSESSLEFTLPPGELDRIFIETRPGKLQRLAAEARRTVSPTARPGVAAPAVATPAVATAPVASAAVPAGPALATPVAPPRAPSLPSPAAPLKVALAPGAAAARQSPTRPSSATPPERALTRIPGLEVSEDVRQEMLSSYAYAELPQINAPRRRVPDRAWLGAALLLGALLVFQIIRSQSAWLTSHSHLLGGSSTAAASLASYQLRQWGVTGDPAAKGTLRVRASIMNTAAQLQPYPLLRVSLANRFGTRVGAREFEPAEYLGAPTARMLAPGERVDATLDILDPGKDAEGFEIDVCIRNAEQKIVCAGDAPAPRSP